MAWTYFLVISEFFAAVTSGILAIYCWRHRDVPAATTLFGLTLSLCIWSVSSFIAMVCQLEKATWVLQGLGISLYVTIPATFLVFALDYTGQGKWLLSRNLFWIIIMPIITGALYYSNRVHHLISEKTEFNKEGPFLMADWGELGAWAYAYESYVYILMFVSGVIILRSSIRMFRIYRMQSILWISIILIFVIAAISTVTPPEELNLLPLANILAPILAFLVVFRYRMLDLKPVARNTLIENMNDGMMVLDEQNRIVDINRAMSGMLDIPINTAIGQSAHNYRKSVPNLEMTFRDELQTEGEVSISIDETTRYYDMLITPLKNRADDMTGRLVILRDITQLKQAEEEIRQSNARLQLRNEELDAFARTVAHDIQGPLAAMTTFIDVLRNGHVDMAEEERARIIQHLRDDSGRISRIIDGLLMLARVSSADQPQIKPLDMSQILNEAQSRVSLLMAQYAAKITAPDLWPQSLGYAPWVEEVWFNYLSNAIKYGGESPNIEITAKVSDGFVKFSIRDYGPGIPPEKQPDLFFPFEQLDHHAFRDGHGLGLSIVRQITEKLGGKIGVESNGIEGDGCVFFFTLPVAPTE